ncbi:uncharacterized protein F4807DRAFT_433989 [Annulohypoxylon truncatum]|uniref:uncharacterized protein n=1 Tax=Annulohypoxylon truncatum TaxID=327061 RepID=UPI002007DA97|nr:uncharacterized protein F4807DRAFT_433989 [Annulohypoxylon truncatum]KAI1207630.1 hypothetical protein F4807DRAFT_433989 [Annulohypoxylon truncatum]
MNMFVLLAFPPCSFSYHHVVHIVDLFFTAYHSLCRHYILHFALPSGISYDYISISIDNGATRSSKSLPKCRTKFPKPLYL